MTCTWTLKTKFNHETQWKEEKPRRERRFGAEVLCAATITVATSIKFEADNQNNELSFFTKKGLFAQAYDLITIFCFLHALCKVHSGVFNWRKWLMGFISWSLNDLFNAIGMWLVNDNVWFCSSSRICFNMGIWDWKRNLRWTMCFCN